MARPETGLKTQGSALSGGKNEVVRMTLTDATGSWLVEGRPTGTAVHSVGGRRRTDLINELMRASLSVTLGFLTARWDINSICVFSM